MLAATTTTTTGDWIVGGIALVVGLGIIVGIVWLLYRLMTWPARARRRRQSAGGLGSDYEQMIRQQQRNQPGGRHLPYPPPEGWKPQPSPPEPAVSQVVMPPPGYRHREPEMPEPDAEPALPFAANPAPVAASSASSTWGRVMRTPIRIPAWVMLPLVWLGALFVFAFPIWGGWAGYGLGLAFAVGLGFWTKRRYYSRTLWRAEHNIVVWVRTGKRDDTLSPPVIVTPVAENRPASTETPN